MLRCKRSGEGIAQMVVIFRRLVIIHHHCQIIRSLSILSRVAPVCLPPIRCVNYPWSYAPGWAPCRRDQTFAAYPELLQPRVQPTKAFSCEPYLLWPPLAPCSSLPQIQDNGTVNRTAHAHPPSASQTTHPSSSAPLNYLSWRHGNRHLAEVAQQSHHPSLFWHRSGGTSSLPRSGLQSRPPESRLTCPGFTWTLHSLHPLPHCPSSFTPPRTQNTSSYTHMICLYVLALNIHTYCRLNTLALKNSTYI